MPELMTPEAFAQSIKAKYPDYASVPDGELAAKMLEKYPEYRDQVKPAAPPPPAADSWRQHPINAQEGQPGTIDKLNEMLGPLAHPQTLTDFARILTLPVDSVRRAAASALGMAAARNAAVASRGPVGSAISATGRGVEAMGNSRAARAAEAGGMAEAAFHLDPKGLAVAAAPTALRIVGRGLQRAGATVTGDVAPAVAAESAPVAESVIAAGGPRPVLAPGAGVNGLPDQKALNDAAIAARRAAYQASPKAAPAAEEVVKASGKMQLTAPEFKEFQRLIQRGVSLPDAEKAVKAARDLASQLGAEPPPVSATKFPKGNRGGPPR